VSQLSSLEELFAGRHFDREVINLCVRENLPRVRSWFEIKNRDELLAASVPRRPAAPGVLPRRCTCRWIIAMPALSNFRVRASVGLG
jgi:hypothetical protein